MAWYLLIYVIDSSGEYNVEEDKSINKCNVCGKYVWADDRVYPYHSDEGIGPVMCRDCYKVIFAERIAKWERNFERGT